MRLQISLLMSLAAALVCAQQQPAYQQYIEQYKSVAIEQQRLYHIPASITMAQGLLESGAGHSELATEANNHFGVKCNSDWQGETYRHDDETKQECFRKYASAEESYADHSRFLLRDRYKSLFTLELTDYQGWARGLSRCGYATDPQYPEKLIRIVEEYHLNRLVAEMPAESAPVTTEPSQEKASVMAADTMDIVEAQDFDEMAKMDVVTIYHDHRSGYQDGLLYIIAEDGESFSSLAYFLNMSEKTLRRYNDATDGHELSPNDRVYLFPKHRRAGVKHPTYFVRKGDTAWSISQKFGIRMKSIYRLNGIPMNTPLVTRQRIRLR